RFLHRDAELVRDKTGLLERLSHVPDITHRLTRTSGEEVSDMHRLRPGKPELLKRGRGDLARLRDTQPTSGGKVQGPLQRATEDVRRGQARFRQVLDRV